MATYCFKCKDCGATFCGMERSIDAIHCETPVVRDYRAESVAFGVVPGAYRDRNSTTYFDKDALKDQGIEISREEVEDSRSFVRNQIDGFIRDSE